MPLQMRGGHGEVRKGYRVAAHLGEWTMDEGGRLQGTPLDVNHYWLDQPGSFELWLWLGRRAWGWREAEILDKGAPFIVRAIGSPVVRDV